LMLRKHFLMRKSCRENEWRDLWTHGLSGPKAAQASFSHVVRNGATGSRVVRAASSTAVSSNTRRTRERQFLRFLCAFLTSSGCNARDFETDGKPGVLKAACRGLSSSAEAVWYLCRRSFTGDFSESCKACDDRAHRAFPAFRSTSSENDRLPQR